MTNQRHRNPRWPAVAVAVLALVGVVLTTLPAEDVEAASAAVEDTVHAQVTAPVRPASFGRRLGGPNPGRTGPIVLGLTIADLGDPATVAVPTAAQPPAARVPAVPRITTTAEPGTAAAAAIAFALVQRGLPYVWGGDGPQSGEAGFDCSGLTTAAYDWAGISLPRTAHTQYYAGPHVPADAQLEPGDLVFYGVPERVHHVGLYLGNGRMINAPTFGKPVRTAFVRYPGDDYLGATRPAAGRDAPGLLEEPDLPFDVPPEPAPDAPPGPAEFPAPPAPDYVPATPAPGTQAPAPPTESAVVAAPGPDAPTSASAPNGSAARAPATGPAADGSIAQAPPPRPGAEEGTAGATTTSGSAAPSAGPPAGDASTPAGKTTGPPTADRAGASTTTPSESTAPTTGDPARSAPAQATTTPPTSTLSADAPEESGARATTPPGSAPASSTPNSSAPAQSTTAPPTRTPRADASTTRPRETADRTTGPPPTSAPARATTPPGDEGTAASSPPSSEVTLPPNAVGLPDGETLDLIAAKAGGAGPVAAPTRAGTASVMRTSGTTVITMPPTVGTVGLSRGGTIQLTDASGDPSEFEVQAKRTVDADTAAGLVASGDNRLVLLQSLDDGRVLVVLAS